MGGQKVWAAENETKQARNISDGTCEQVYLMGERLFNLQPAPVLEYPNN